MWRESSDTLGWFLYLALSLSIAPSPPAIVVQRGLLAPDSSCVLTACSVPPDTRRSPAGDQMAVLLHHHAGAGAAGGGRLGHFGL